MRTVGIWLAVFVTIAGNGVPAEDVVIGRKIQDFRLRDYRGAEYSLTDVKERKLVVVAFLATECPLAQQYATRLAELELEFGKQGVAFFGIISNPQETLADIERFVAGQKIQFPVLKDLGGAIADQFGAKRTPEVFVLDTQRTIRYCGRIDDQFGVGYKRPKPQQRDLAVALGELLAAQAVSRPVVDAVGCYIGRTPKNPPSGNVTYSNDIAPLLENRCVDCHRSGDIAPFPLSTYAETMPWGETIQQVISERRMPPWHASSKHGKFANDPTLSDAEIKLVCAWVQNGMPEGVKLSQPRNADATNQPAVAEWRIGKPDLVLQMPVSFSVPASGTVDYQYYLVDPGLRQDRWVTASEVRPSNRQVTHHALVFVQPPGGASVISKGGFGFQMLGTYGPGVPPIRLTEGLAKFVPAGSLLVFQMHYTPCGTEQLDQTQVGLVFADPAKVKKEHRSAMVINHEFRIPPEASDYTIEATYPFRQDQWLYTMAPHMHLRGKSFQFEAFYPDGSREMLLDVPRWDFEWQHMYHLAVPKLMPEGTRLRCTAHFDNSDQNPWNPDPKRAVSFGLQTSEEMMVGFLQTALVEQDLTLGGPQVKPLAAGPNGDVQYEVTFKYRPSAEVGATSVYLAGEFNKWKRDAQKMEGPDADGVYNTRITLKKGRYEYKFLIDGKTWKHDPGNAHQAGYYNNSLVIVE